MKHTSVLERPNHVRTPDTEGRIQQVQIAIAIIAFALPLLSYVIGLYDHIQHWGKLVHGVDGFCIAFLFGVMLIAWRDYQQVDVTDELAGLFTICFGIVVGVLSEIVAFVRDWVANSDLQKSNTDTMTDFLCNDVAVVIGALIAVRVMSRRGSQERLRLGKTAEWLIAGPSRLLDRHGFALGLFAGLAIAASVASLWFSDRPVPGLPIP